ncbi:MAG: LysM repeat protein [Candidatus Azotimanducaceae bacterium]|mgnify:CR=1 FL=1|jgi:LysM repeat protein|tara:strand:+ start:4972 stop:5445 length:474 start_codon:yes stop_codon:yes gene_type:complete
MGTTLHTAHRSHVQVRSAQPLTFVSATSLCVEAEVRGMVRPKVPNYPIRRLLVGTAALGLALAALVATVGLLAGFQGSPASASGVEPALTGSSDSSDFTDFTDFVAPASIHVAQPGDTLWSIADTYRGDISRDRYIGVLIQMNGDTGVASGEAIWLP